MQAAEPSAGVVAQNGPAPSERVMQICTPGTPMPLGQTTLIQTVFAIAVPAKDAASKPAAISFDFILFFALFYVVFLLFCF
jgi:hypothetical protein